MPENASRTEKSEQLSPKQEMLITLMLAGVAINAAAAQIGIAEKTAFRWLQNDNFKKAYRSAQHDLFRDAMQELHALISKAIRTLDRNLSEDIEASVQIRAAKIVLDQALAVDRMTELEEMQEKIARFEQLL